MNNHAYGQTWWSKGWIDTFAGQAGLDPGQMIRGRAYARGDRVSDLNIEPGVVDALVQGSRFPYTVTITVPVLNDAGWVRLLDLVAARAEHLAALLGGEIPRAVGAEVDLLVGLGEWRTTCSCPDLARICRHRAAVCYVTAEVFDADPFALLLLRGRTRAEVLSDLRARRQPTWSSPAGMLARDAYSRPLGSLPAPAAPPDRPGTPARLPAEPPAVSGVTALELSELAATAARRAWNLLRN